MSGEPTTRGSSRARTLLILVRGLWGAALLLAPRRLVRWCSGSTPTPAVVGARVLGIREITQALLLARHRGEPPPRWSIAVDLTHALSMLLVAAKSARLRRPALASATCALCLAGLFGYER